MIRFKLATKGYGGREIKKTIRVTTNDPKNATIELHLAGQVKQFAIIEPDHINLKGILGETISQTVTIIPQTDVPFKILQIHAMKGADFTQSIKETEIKGKKAYELTVVNKRTTEGRYYDKLILLTDQSDHQPIILIVSGEIRKPGAENSGLTGQEVQPAPVQAVPSPK